MARPRKFSDDDILDGAARAVVTAGSAASIADVGREIAGPSGSIYHRFGSRDELFARLWIRSIRRFHEGFLVALKRPDPHEAVAAAARHIPKFCRENPNDARAMMLYRQSVLMESGPESVREDVTQINENIDAETQSLATRRYSSATSPNRAAADSTTEGPDGFHLIWAATRLNPYGMVRPFIAGPSMPGWLDSAVEASSLAIARLGD